jgi:hypothetical protein
MDLDIEMNCLECPQGEDDGDNAKSNNEYNSHDNSVVCALLAPNTQTREQSKQPVTGIVATLWNQIGSIVVKVSVSASPSFLFSDPETLMLLVLSFTIIGVLIHW